MEQPNVLVVDDDREIVRAIAKLLEMEGMHVLKAYNGLEAMDVLMTQNVQLILLDVMMPQMDGLSATLRPREQKHSHHHPVRQNGGQRQRCWGCPWERTIM